MGKILCLLGILFLWLQVGLSQDTPDPAPNATSSKCASTVEVEVTFPSDDTKRQLTRFLTKDSPNVRLIFLYFDLNLSSQIYHPGSCPNDGFSPIDAQTPLTWVLTYLPNGDDIFDHFNFPRAYLTLPVAHPRLYSAGYLDDKYVRYMNYLESKLEVRVTDSLTQSNDSCWLFELSLQEKASLVNEQINRRVAELLQTNITVSNWRTCYSKPISNVNELPESVSSFLPYTPAYVCSNSTGKLADKILVADSYLGWFTALTLVIGYGFVVIEVWALFRLFLAIRSWGAKKKEKTETSDTSNNLEAKRFKLEPKYVNKAQLPTRFTIAGLLQSDNMLGEVVFQRAKSFSVILILLGLFVALPSVLLSIVFQGDQSGEHTEMHILPEDTFGPCNTFTQSSLDTESYSFVAALIAIILTAILIITMIYLDFQGYLSTTMLRILQESTRVPARWGYILSNVPVMWVRCLLCGGPGPIICKSNNVPYSNRSVPFKVLFWLLCIPFLLFLASFFSVCYIVLELIYAVYTSFLPAMAFYVCNPHQNSSTWNTSKTSKTIAIVFLVSCVPFFFVFSLLTFLSIFSREVICFIALTFIGFFLRNPIQTSMITTWVVTLIVQAKKIFRSYEAPVKAIRKLHTKKVKKIIKKSQLLAEADIDKRLIQTLPETSLCLKKSSELPDYGKIDWETFLKESEYVYDTACYKHLIKNCPYSLMGTVAMARAELENAPAVDQDLEWPWPIDPRRCWDVNHKMLESPPEADSEQEKMRTDVRNDVQYFLQVRLFNHIIVGLAGACVLLLFLFLLLSFDELWNTAKNEINAILLNALFVPIFIYISGGENTSPLGVDKGRLKKIIDRGLKDALQKAKDKFDEINPGSGEASTTYLTSSAENTMPENPTIQSSPPRSSEISSQSDRRPLLAAKHSPQTGGQSAGPPAPHRAASPPPGRSGAPPAPGKPGPPPPPHKGGTPPPPGPSSRSAGAPPPPGPSGRSAAQPAPSRRRPPPPPAHGGGGGDQLSESVYESYELPQPGFKMQQRATSNA